MVAIVSGQGLGLLDSSLINVGASGGALTGGQAGGSAHVNIANGNLILNFTDETLSGTGADLVQTRAYNSQGVLNDGDGDNWRWNGEKKVRLASGTLNAAGSTLARTTGDGHESIYTWNGSAYVSTDGAGAHDSISYSGTEYVWTEGSGKAVERYDSSTGNIKSLRDAKGNGFDYTYSGSQLTKIKDLLSGQTVEFTYGADGKLDALSTRETATGVLSKQVHYAHDTYGRLTSVKTDLTPANNSIADGKYYETSYVYDGTSLRIKEISQSDGVKVGFTYDASNRIATVTDQSGTTTFTYGTGYTNVKNGEGQTWRYDFYTTNTNGEYHQLKQVTSPTTDGGTQTLSYTYKEGEVASITDSQDNVVSYAYDANGNRTSESDGSGNTITRTYSDNLLITEVRTGVSGAETSRFAYDSERNLRYTVSAEGRVSEFEYNGNGQVLRSISYIGGTYTGSSFTETSLNAWVSSQDQSQVQLTENAYDYRGNLTKSIAYGAVSTNGQGKLDNAATVTEYVYSAHGQLLQTFSTTGSTRATKTEQTSYSYDGMGRVATATNAGVTSTTTYSTGTVSVANAATGLTTVSSYNTRGQLESLTQSGSGQSRVTEYAYDSAGRVIETTNSLGHKTYTYYDEAGRVEFNVNAEGGATGYKYNSLGQVSSETAYSNAFDHTSVAVTANTTKDITTSYVYDDAGRITKTTQEHGSLDVVTDNVYDSAGRLIESTVGGTRQTRYFYDQDGLQIGMLNAEGYLVETVYDNAGRVSGTIRYSAEVTGTTFTGGSFAQVKAVADNSAELYTYNYYDAQGRLIGHVDEQGFLTETVFEPALNQTRTIQYMTAVTPTSTSTLASLRSIADNDGTQTSTVVVDNYGRVTQSITATPSGVNETINYFYDNAGRLVRQQEMGFLHRYAVGSDNESFTQYNAFGEVTGAFADRISGPYANIVTLDANGVPLASSLTAAIDSNGVRFEYDTLGRKIAEYGAEGQKTSFFYDDANRLTYTANAEGQVTQTTFNHLGQVASTRLYTNTLSAANINALTGGAESLIVGKITTNSLDNYVELTYNALGQVESKTGARGYVTTNSYDKYGQVWRTQSGITGSTQTDIRYTRDNLGRATLTQAYNGSAWENTLVAFDGFGRTDSTTNARGNVTQYDYLNNGRTIKVTAPTGSYETTTYDALGRTLSVVDGRGKTTSYAYSENSVIITTPEGSRIQTWYNQNGDIIRVKDGESRSTYYEYMADRQLNKITQDGVVISDNDFDKSGRIIEHRDGNNVLTRYTYDKAGNVTLKNVDVYRNAEQTQYTFDGQGRKLTVTKGFGTLDASTTQYSYFADGQVKQVIVDPTGLKLSTTFTYDGLGNVLTMNKGSVASPNQQTTSYTYDRAGRKLSETTAGLTTQYRYDLTGNLTRIIDARGYSSWMVYDDVGRKTYDINAEGGVTRYTYDKKGQLYHTRQYVNEISTSSLGDVVTSVSVATSNTGDRQSMNIYDDDGNMRFLLQEQSYNVWMVTENIYDNSGNVIEIIQYDKSFTQSHINSYIDANVTDNVAASDATVVSRLSSLLGRSSSVLGNSRKTIFEYDESNRQTKTTLSGWYDVNDGQVYASNSGSDRFQRTTETTYDNMGNAVRNAIRIGTGASDFVYQYKTYDGAGRIVHDIDAEGGVTKYGYDALGNQTSITRYYNDANNVSTSANGEYWHYRERVVGGSDSYDRKIINDYDNGGRLTRTVTLVNNDNVKTDVISSLTNNPETRYEYDDVGNVVKERVKVTSSTWADTYHYYDGANRKVLTVDAEKYGTKTAYDAVGNVTSTTEYSKAYSSTLNTASQPAFSTTTTDRVTRFTYDKIGQVINTYQDNVTYTNTQTSSRLTNQSNKLMSTNVYNAFGEKTSTAAQGVTSTYAYNKAGQSVDIKGATVSLSNNANPFSTTSGSSVTGQLRMTTEYNIFGDVTSETQEGIAADDRATFYEYDHAGNAITTIDAEGIEHTKEYSISGNVIAEQTVLVNGEVVRREYQYDNVGRQTHSLDVFTMSGVEHKSGQQSVYNSFGDIVEEYQVYGKSGGSSQQLARYVYDRTGNLFKKQDGNGHHFYEHNFVGNIVEERHGEAETIREYDLLGRLTVERQPSYQGLSNATTSTSLKTLTPEVTQEYDRWGNVTQSTDAAGNVTNYVYDQANRVIKETLPTTQRMNENGTTNSVRLVKQYHYNLKGELVRQSEGVNSVETIERYRYYDSAGQMTQEVDATGVITDYRYNEFGEEVGRRDGLGHVFTTSYNNKGLVTQSAYATEGSIVNKTFSHYSYEFYDEGSSSWTETHTHYDVSTYWGVEKSILVQNEYDNVGRKIQERDAAGNLTSHVYDGRGKRTQTTDIHGYKTTYVYDSIGNKLQEYKDSKDKQTYTYSYKEYEVGRVDTMKQAGGKLTTYEYDYLGRVDKEIRTGTGAQSVKDTRYYTFLDNGLVASIKDDYGTSTSVNNRVTNYGYDVRGNRVYEETEVNQYSRTSSVDTRSHFDEHNRLSKVVSPSSTAPTTTGSSRSRSVLNSLTYHYDDYGNRRLVETQYQKQNSGVKYTDSAYFTYDKEGRTLIENGNLYNNIMAVEKGAATYSYNANGQVQSKSYVSGSQTYGRQYDTKYEFEQKIASLGGIDSDAAYEYFGGEITEHYSTNYNSSSTGVDSYDSEAESWYQVKIKTPTYKSTVYDYDQYGREVSTTGTSSTSRYDSLGNRTYYRYYDSWKRAEITVTSEYSNTGRLISQKTIQQKDYAYNGVTWTTNSSTDYKYDSLGNITSYKSNIYDKNSTRNIDYTYTYNNAYGFVDGGSYQQTGITVTSSQGGSTPGNTSYSYNSTTGYLDKVTVQNGSSDTTYKYFYYDNDGKVIAKSEKTGDKQSYSDHFYQNGNVLGSITANSVDFTTKVQQESGASSNSYVLSGGETLGQIAQIALGDASLWYIIANANGLTMGIDEAFSSSDIGTSLSIPNVSASMQNKANNFKPYNPGEIIGDVSPSPVPPPPPSGCSGIATVIMVVVAVAVTVFTAGAALAAMGAAGVGGAATIGSVTAGMGAVTGLGAAAASTGALMGAMAVGGFMGSVASQLVGMAMGEVDSFSLKQALVSGVTSAVGAGMGVGGGAAKLVGNGGQYAKVAVQAVTSYTANYAASKIAGLETSFSWKGMAAQVAGSMAGAKVGSEKLFGENNFANGFASSAAAGFTSGELSHRWNGGDINYAQVALDAFGNAIGNSIVAGLSKQPKPKMSKEDMVASTQLSDLYSGAISDTDTRQELMERFGISEIPSHIGTDLNSDSEKLALLDEIMKQKPDLSFEEASRTANLLDAKRDVDDINSMLASVSADINGYDTLARTSKLLSTMLINKDIYFNNSLDSLLPTGISRISGNALTKLTGFKDSDFVDENIGYFGALYQNNTITNSAAQYIYANRGTDTGVDWGANIADGMGFATDQFSKAISLADKFVLNETLGGNLEFTGHSLGGGLAAAQSLRTGYNSIILNAKGLSDGTISRHKLNVGYSDRIAAFELQGELLSSVQDSWLVEGLVKPVGTVTKNIVAAGGALVDLFSGDEIDTHAFGIASLDSAYGNRTVLPSYNANGNGMSGWNRFTNTLDLHSMDAVISSSRYALHNGQLTEDMLKHIRIK